MPDLANYSSSSAPDSTVALATPGAANSTANDACYSNSAAAQATANSVRRSRWRLPMWLKLSIYFGLPLLAGITALGVVTLDSQRSFQDQQLDSFARVISEHIAASVTEPLFADALMEINVLIQKIPLTRNVVGVAVTDHRGALLASSGKVPVAGQFDPGRHKAALAPAHFYPAMGKQQADIDHDGLHNLVLYSSAISFRDVVGGHALVVVDSGVLNRQFEQMTYALALATALLIAFLVAVVLFCSHRVMTPVTNIVDAAKRIQRGDRSPILERRDDELGQLITAINAMTRGLAEKSQIESALGKFLAPNVAQKILQEIDTVDFRGENVEATVLFADIVGFTSLSERMTPEQVSALLNEYFGYYSACANLYFGTVDKFLGDCIMLVFGATNNDKDHRYHAAACAVLMQNLTAAINTVRIEQNLTPIYLRIGLNSGSMLAGLLGSKDRMEYTVIGDSVNLASRLCNEAEQQQIIIQQELHRELEPYCKATVDHSKTIKVRGKAEPVPIFNLTGITHKHSAGDKALINDLLEKARTSLTCV